MGANYSQNHMSLLWDQCPKAWSVKEVLLTCVQPLCPKTFQAVIFPQSPTFLPHTLREDSSRHGSSISDLENQVFLALWRKSKHRHGINSPLPPVGHICEAHSARERWGGDILVWGRGERASGKLQICQVAKVAKVGRQMQHRRRSGRRKCQKKLCQWQYSPTPFQTYQEPSKLQDDSAHYPTLSDYLTIWHNCH